MSRHPHEHGNVPISRAIVLHPVESTINVRHGTIVAKGEPCTHYEPRFWVGSLGLRDP